MLIAADSATAALRITYSTTDGGHTWKRHPEIAFSAAVYSTPKLGYPVEWIDDTTAVAIAQDNMLYMSTDKGETWQARSILPTEPYAVTMLPNGLGYCSGSHLDVYRTTDRGASWIRIRDRSYFNNTANRGCICGDSSYVVITHNGDRIVTTDQGTTWIDGYVEPALHLTTPQFFTKDFGFCDVDLEGESLTYTHWMTRDGGTTWVEYTPLGYVEDLRHTSPSIAYAFRRTNQLNDTAVMKSCDTGRTWITVLRSAAAEVPINNAPSMMHRGDDTVFVLLLSQGILRTYDGGQTWTTATGLVSILPQGEYVDCLDMRRMRYSWATTRSRVLRSHDDGVTWDSVMTTLSAGVGGFQGMSVIDGDNIAVYAWGDESMVFRTTDAGTTWNTIVMQDVDLWEMATHPVLRRDGSGVTFAAPHLPSICGNGSQIVLYATSDFWRTSRAQFAISVSGMGPRLVFLDASTGWIFLGNRIYHTNTGGIDVADRALSPAVPWLAQNYPNPAAGMTTIPYSIPPGTAQPVRIELFDALGRRLRTLCDGDVAPGEHRLSFDASSLTAGAYFVVLTLKEKREVRTMIVSR
jgi:photosystem II stability/assembly factor-like uncharacterized protein